MIGSFEDRSRVSSSSASMAPLVSGSITSATAQGTLPQYRGTATASLAPTTPDRSSSKLFPRQLPQQFQQGMQVRGEEARVQEALQFPTSRRDAADYLRSVAEKDQRENQKVTSSFPSNSGRSGNQKGGGF